MLKNFASFLNILFENIYLKNLLFLLSGILMGYTLQPVPEWLNHLFNTSIILKFIILFISCISILHPMDSEKIIISFVCCTLTLILFEISRRKDVEKKMKKILNY